MKALITGISGQDGSYLAELLLSQGYEVHGIVRRTALEAPSRKLSNLQAIAERLVLHTASLENHVSLYKVISEVQPDECYHLAASSFVSYSFDDEFSLLASNFNGTHYLLASIKEVVPNCRFYFGGVHGINVKMFHDAPISAEYSGILDEARVAYHECLTRPSLFRMLKLASWMVWLMTQRVNSFAVLSRHQKSLEGFDREAIFNSKQLERFTSSID